MGKQARNEQRSIQAKFIPLECIPIVKRFKCGRPIFKPPFEPMRFIAMQYQVADDVQIGKVYNRMLSRTNEEIGHITKEEQ